MRRGGPWDWATSKYRERAAVLEATVDVGFCLDFTDNKYTSVMRLAYERIREAYIASNTPLSVNRRKANYLDCLVINYLGKV